MFLTSVLCNNRETSKVLTECDSGKIVKLELSISTIYVSCIASQNYSNKWYLRLHCTRTVYGCVYTAESECGVTLLREVGKRDAYRVGFRAARVMMIM